VRLSYDIFLTCYRNLGVLRQGMLWALNGAQGCHAFEKDARRDARDRLQNSLRLTGWRGLVSLTCEGAASQRAVTWHATFKMGAYTGRKGPHQRTHGLCIVISCLAAYSQGIEQRSCTPEAHSTFRAASATIRYLCNSVPQLSFPPVHGKVPMYTMVKRERSLPVLRFWLAEARFSPRVCYNQESPIIIPAQEPLGANLIRRTTLI